MEREFFWVPTGKWNDEMTCDELMDVIHFQTEHAKFMQQGMELLDALHNEKPLTSH